MSLAAAWALVGLASLPVLWWLHIRRKRPPVVDTPSLMFVLDEDERTRLPRGRRMDPELLLTLVAAALLTLAAAGPVWTTQRAYRVVRVVVAGGPSAARAGYEEGVAKTLDTMRSALASEDELDVVWLGAPDRSVSPPVFSMHAPSQEALLAEARAGDASVRYVISDRAPDALPDDVGWIALGAPEATNAGITHAQVFTRDDAEQPSLHVVVLVDGGAAPAFVGRDAAWRAPLTPAAQGTLVGTLELSAGDDEATTQVRLLHADGRPWNDDLALDDVVTLHAGALRVHIDPALHEDTQRALRAALGAAADAGVREAPPAEAALVFGASDRPPGAARFVQFTNPPDGPGVALPAGTGRRMSSPLATDLTLRGHPWRYARAPEAIAPERVLLGRYVDGRLWPALVQDSATHLRFLPVPPAPSSTFWPLLVANVLEGLLERRSVGQGVAQGVLDPEVTQLGRDVAPFTSAALRAVPPDRRPRTLSLRLPLLLLGLLALAALWLLPAFRRESSVHPALSA